MKKTVTFILTLFFLLTACNNEEKNENIASKDFISKIVKENIDIKMFERPISLEGKLKVWSNKSNEIVVFTETTTHIHIFILQNHHGKLQIDETYDKIIYLDHSLSLISNNKNSKKSLILEIKDKIESANTSKQLMTLMSKDKIETIQGDGIVHVWLKKNSPEILAKEVTLEKLYNAESVFRVIDGGGDGGTGTGAICDSGGTGSTSCSVTGSNGGSGCSVSCNSGYYACCNGPGGLFSASCKCIAIKK